MNMQTTIADFVLSNPANQDVDKTTFETGLDFDSIITDAEPTLVYVKNRVILLK